MLLFVFDRALFRFELIKPALPVLFQLPPRIRHRNDLLPLLDKAGSFGFFQHAAYDLAYFIE